MGLVLRIRTAISASDRTPSRAVQGRKTSVPPFVTDRDALIVDGVGCWPDHIRILCQTAHPPGG